MSRRTNNNYNGKKGRIPAWAKQQVEEYITEYESFEEAYAKFLCEIKPDEPFVDQIDRAFKKYALDNGCIYPDTELDDKLNAELANTAVDPDVLFEEFLADFDAAVQDASCDVEAVTNLINMGYHK